jgi:hypothetical protein
MKNQYYPASPIINFIIEMLIGAVRNQPVLVLTPIVFAAFWSLWCLFAGKPALLKKGSIATLSLLFGSCVTSALFLFMAVGLVAGGKMGLVMNVLTIISIIITVVIYYGIIPTLIAITIKEKSSKQSNPHPNHRSSS